MVEFTDQLHRPFECMNAAVAMVADVHHPPTGRTSTVEQIKSSSRRAKSVSEGHL